MTIDESSVEVDFTPDFWERYARSSLVFLSASVPGGRRDEEFTDGRVRDEYHRFVRHHDAEQIREAFTWIAGRALALGYTLVCGGHPALSPTLLHVAMRVFADRAPPSPRVLIFQSRHFKAIDIREETRTIASLGLGRIVFTTAASTPTNTDARDPSLSIMRQAMLGDRTVCRPAPRFAAAFFIGGMYGIYEEAAVFRAIQPKVPTYALGRPGGAAAALLEDRVDPLWYDGNAAWRRLLAAKNFSSAALPPTLLATAAYPVIVERALGRRDRPRR